VQAATAAIYCRRWPKNDAEAPDTQAPLLVAMAQFRPVFREPVNGSEHFREDALRTEGLIVGKLRNTDTLLFHAQERSPEFINLRSNGGVGRIHEKTPGKESLGVQLQRLLGGCRR
jgi:hypothetical protein